MDKASSSQMKSSSELSYAPSEASRGRSFLSALFSHNRSQSTDTPPPSYESSVAPTASTHQHRKSGNFFGRSKKPQHMEDALEMLGKYDTVILLDDSSSMKDPGSMKGGTRWYEAGEALAALADTAQKYDTDGIDIYFLNNRTKALNIKSSSEVLALFAKVRPSGATPTGERLDQILKPRLCILEQAQKDGRIEPDGTPMDKSGKEIKRVNLIVITDGEATDNPKHAIIDAASRLKKISNLCLTQLGIQFVQVGNDWAATRALEELDDDLQKERDIRDIVDTVPYSKLNPLTSEGLIKVLLGAINRKVDETKLK